MVELLPFHHESLHKPSLPIIFIDGNPHSIKEMMENATMDLFGMGLSGVQIDFPYQVFSIVTKDYKDTFFNPMITWFSNDKTTAEEGCLSFPGLVLLIQRSNSVTLCWSNVEGNDQEKTFSGLTARCIQHEMDHLDGITFDRKTSLYHRNKIYHKWLKTFDKITKK